MASISETGQDAIFPRIDDERFEDVWEVPPGLWGQLRAVQNQPIGMRFLAVSFFFFILAGLAALTMRFQLAVPENTLLDPETYNRFFTMHGSTMMFLVLVPLIEGLATLVLPQMLGSRELPYPRLTAFSFWAFLFGGIIFYMSFFFNAVPDTGWFAYVPLSNIEYSPDVGLDFWLLGLNVAEIGAIAGAFEIIVSVLKMRAPGMTLNRIPIFAWAMLVTAFMMIFGFTPLIVGSILLELDRKLLTNFYRPDLGGDPLLWEHLFWIFGHPDVYIQFLPAVGIVSTIVPVFSRRPLVGYPLVVISLVATGFLSFGLWVHHMFSTGLPALALAFFTGASFLIAIPSGIQVFAWIATIWNGKPNFKTPFLFVLGFFIIFIIGGLTGVMVAAVPFNLQVHDSYFVVAHFHYVLFGGVVFPIFAAFYYWAPKFVGKMLDERLGRWHFWLMLIGFNVAFFPMHISGFLGMPRRVYTYQEGLGLGLWNMISTIGAVMVTISILIFIINFFWSLRNGPDAPDNPWDADTLEWATPTPSPQYGFRKVPIVRSRHPLWDQDNFDEGPPEVQRVVEGLARWPVTWRSQISTTVLDARPVELFRVPKYSIWPLVVAAGAMLMSFFLIFDQNILALISLVVAVFGLAAWNISDDWFYERDDEEDALFEQRFGIPVRRGGSLEVARAAIYLTMLTITVALLSLLFTYLYLRLNAPQWPPAGLPLPDLLLPSLALAAVIIGAGLMWVANRSTESRDQRPALRGWQLRLSLG